MSATTQWSKRLAAVGIVLAVFEYVFPELLFGLPGFIVQIFGLWWVFIGVGVIGLVMGRRNLSIPTFRTKSSLERDDIITSTNWSRTGKYTLQKSYGVAIVVAATIAFILSLIVGNSGLAILWVVVAVAGTILSVVAWRRGRDIISHETSTFSVRAPDMFAAHDFHIALRQAAEDLGYATEQETSPGIGGQPAEHNGELFHAKGGFKARQRPIASSRIVVPDVEDNPFVSDLLTLSTVGVVAILIGFTSLASASIPLETALATDEFDIVYFVGPLFLFGGIIATAYDYFIRTREWGELYAVEEGSIHGSTTRVYEDSTLEQMKSDVEPTVTTAESSATLSVTVGAKCSTLFDDEKLEDDLETLAETVEEAAEEHELKLISDDDGAAAAGNETTTARTEPQADGTSSPDN